MFDLITNLHFGVLAKIVAIDLVLGIDNAVVIALAVAMLSVELRNKAIMLGTAGAILARILFLFIGFWLVGLPFVKLLAGGYLVYLAYSMLKSGDEDHDVKQSTSMWGAIWVIVSADLMMSLDNVVALVGASEGTGNHAFGYTVFGILISIPIIIFASKFLVTLLDKFPVLVNLGAGLIAWVGIEMMLKEDFNKLQVILSDHTTSLTIAIAITAFIVLLNPIKGLIEKIKNRKQQVV